MNLLVNASCNLQFLSGRSKVKGSVVVAWVNILPRNPYHAVPAFLKILILLTGKTGSF